MFPGGRFRPSAPSSLPPHPPRTSQTHQRSASSDGPSSSGFSFGTSYSNHNYENSYQSTNSRSLLPLPPRQSSHIPHSPNHRQGHHQRPPYAPLPNNASFERENLAPLPPLPLPRRDDSSESDLYLRRSSSFESSILHSTDAQFAHHIHRLNGMIHDLQQDVYTLTGDNVQMKNQLQQILVRLDKEAVSEDPEVKPTRKKSAKGVANQHPQLKNDVHAMFWRLVGIDANAEAQDKDAKMYDGHDSEDHYILVDGSGAGEGQSKIWKPNYMLAVNTTKNKAFIRELVDRVYETEALNRQSSRGRLPNESFDKGVIKSVAQTYFSSIASTFKKMRTEEGKKKLLEEGELKRRRGRRETVTAARRDVVPEFEATYKVSGAAALLDTDFASSAVVGVRGDWMVIGKKWRRKAYIRFLRELDRFIAAKLKAQKTITDGPPPTKRQRTNPKKSTPRFHATLDKASDRPPKSAKHPPIVPIAGMVKKSWNKARTAKVETLSNPDWWGSWVENAEELPEEVQARLDELPSDSSTGADSE
ncbi:hypothetical protein MVEN_00081100 [Mycena venus]|uniref:Uncharacterized protein n=1 Tax=Mycena venus TaxID=2733690 RepID=A0A8H6Z7J5_9AGAR|nr:hypothetical protein MVEN_00081100 [Mycena venus]